MKTITKIILASALMCPLASSAHDFSTEEAVRYVLNCMGDIGELSDENLYTCSCRLDALGESMTYAEYDDARTYERNKDMPGEKGGFFRSSELGEQMYNKLVEVRKDVINKCPVIKSVKRPPTTEE